MSIHASVSHKTPTLLLVPAYIADAMKFNGPAPELINGRLAMVGPGWRGVRQQVLGCNLAQRNAAQGGSLCL